MTVSRNVTSSPIAVLLVFVLVAFPANVGAQDAAAPASPAPRAAAASAEKAPPTPKPAKSAAEAVHGDQPLVVPGLALAEDALRARLERVKSATAVMGPGARAQVVASYETAVSDLATAVSLARKASAFEEARAEAPQVFSVLQKEAAAPIPAPKIKRQLSAAELESLLRDFQTELDAARILVAKIKGEQNKRARRRLESPRQLADAAAEVADIDTRLRVAPSPPEGDEVAIAERAALLARRELLLATLAFNEKEIESYDARRDLLALKRDQAMRRMTRLDESVRELRDVLREKRTGEAAVDAAQAQQEMEEVGKRNRLLRPLAQRNKELAELRSGPEGLTARIEEARAAIADTGNELERVTQRYDRSREKAEAVGFTPAIGLMLRKERAELPDIAEQQRAIRERHAEIGDVQLRLIELEDERDGVADIDVLLRRLMAKVDPAADARTRRSLETDARDLLLTQRGYLDSLIDDYDAYFTSLVELDAKERDLVTGVRRYASFIDENVMWIRGPSLASLRMIDGTRSSLEWLLRPSKGRRLGEGVMTTLSGMPLTAVLAILSWCVLLVYRGRAQALLADLCPSRAKALGMPFTDTLRALIVTAALASLGPGLIALIAFLISGVEGASGEFGEALGTGLRATAMVYFVAELLRRLCKPNGAGEIHLGWPAKATATVRRALAGGMAVGLPALAVVVTLDAQSNDVFKSSLGRIAFIVGMLTLALAAYRALLPGAGLLDDAKSSDTGWTAYIPRAIRIVGTAAPLVLVVMVAAGYDFAALSIARKAAQTTSVALLLFLIRAVILRWLMLARRRMALRQAWEAQAARAQAEGSAASEGAEGAPAPEPDAVDIGAVNAQTRRLVHTFLAASLLIATWLIWHDVLPALRVFERVELWQVSEQVTEKIQTDSGEQQRTMMQQRPVTLADLVTAIVIALLAFVAAHNIPGLLEVTVLQRFDTGLRYAVTSISRYLIAAIGGVLAVSALGVSWSKVQWLAAAVSVGLGFGLQEIFANFISGLIILFERPIRVGDVVTLGQSTGRVSRIRIRATTIVDADRKELIVPNKEFITGQLVNWTLSDQMLRVVVQVGVAYGSDTESAERLLARIAQECEYVLREPAPGVTLESFGADSLNFQLAVFTANLERAGRARHAVSMAIDKEFRKAGIEIAYPQRDLHIRSFSGPIPVTLRDGMADTGATSRNDTADAAATRKDAADEPVQMRPAEVAPRRRG